MYLSEKKILKIWGHRTNSLPAGQIKFLSHPHTHDGFVYSENPMGLYLKEIICKFFLLVVSL